MIKKAVKSLSRELRRMGTISMKVTEREKCGIRPETEQGGCSFQLGLLRLLGWVGQRAQGVTSGLCGGLSTPTPHCHIHFRLRVARRLPRTESLLPAWQRGKEHSAGILTCETSILNCFISQVEEKIYLDQ